MLNRCTDFGCKSCPGSSVETKPSAPAAYHNSDDFVRAICMKFPLAAGLFFSALYFVAFEPARAQPCLTAEVCRAFRLQQQAAQEQAEEYARQRAAEAAQQQRLAKAAAAARTAELREAQAREYDRQQAAIQQARLIAEQQAAAQREADARARVVEETRIAILRAAEASSDNHCREPSVAGKIIEYYNSLVEAGDASYKSVDIEHLITENFDPEARTMSCHGTFVLTNGNRRNGSITARPNVAGNIIVSFHETEH
jgi:hypothetical protein